MILLHFLNRSRDENSADNGEAGETNGQEDADVSPQRIKEVFCWSMAISFLSLD